MMGMSSPEWSRYLHDVGRASEPPEEINDEVVRRMLARYATDLPVIARRGRGGPTLARARGSGSPSRRPPTGR